VKEWFFEKKHARQRRVWMSRCGPIQKQSYLLSADGENNEIRVIRREDAAWSATFGGNA